MPEQRTKKYVEVIADFSPEGILTPQTVIWDTGQKFDITCISEVLPRKYSKTGGVGVRYTCQIGRAKTYLFFEEDRWFVEAKENAAAETPAKNRRNNRPSRLHQLPWSSLGRACNQICSRMTPFRASTQIG